MTADRFCDQFGLGQSDRFTVMKMMSGKDIPIDDFKKEVVERCKINPIKLSVQTVAIVETRKQSATKPKSE